MFHLGTIIKYKTLITNGKTYQINRLIHVLASVDNILMVLIWFTILNLQE